MLTSINGFSSKVFYVLIGLTLIMLYYLTMLVEIPYVNTYSIHIHVIGMIRIFMASIFGSIIGYERAHKNRPAGLRTHSLVCVGSAVVMVIPMILGLSDSELQMDVTRLGAQVISGIGFLGAGTIIRNGANVKGLTTAATLWVVAIIGLTVGAGLYAIGIFVTALIHFVLRNFKADE